MTFIEYANQQVCIPVIQKMKQLEKFVDTDLKICILQDVHISLLGSMVTILHQKDKIVLVHLDMIHGIANDEYGTEYVCQKLNCDGIISAKSKAIEMAKKNKKYAIQRMFLVDSKSVERGIEMIHKSRADAIELMPAIAFSIIPYIKSQIDIPLIGGGLLKTIVDLKRGLDAGFVAFSLGDLDLCIIAKKQL